MVSMSTPKCLLGLWAASVPVTSLSLSNPVLYPKALQPKGFPVLPPQFLIPILPYQVDHVLSWFSWLSLFSPLLPISLPLSPSPTSPLTAQFSPLVMCSLLLSLPVLDCSSCLAVPSLISRIKPFSSALPQSGHVFIFFSLHTGWEFQEPS